QERQGAELLSQTIARVVLLQRVELQRRRAAGAVEPENSVVAATAHRRCRRVAPAEQRGPRARHIIQLVRGAHHARTTAAMSRQWAYASGRVTNLRAPRVNRNFSTPRGNAASSRT